MEKMFQHGRNIDFSVWNNAFSLDCQTYFIMDYNNKGDFNMVVEWAYMRKG